MNLSTPLTAAGLRRRVVLVDFDWTDADAVPELLRLPYVHVCRVVGRSAADPGVRVASLCGVPTTIALEDLTREAFDVALIGAGSDRRSRVYDLLHAAGTEVHAPHEFLASTRWRERRAPAPDSSLPELVGISPEQLTAIVDGAIPDLASGEDPAPWWTETKAPNPEDRLGLERFLAAAAHRSGAFAAAWLPRGTPTGGPYVSSGPSDPLMMSLAELATRLDVPQIVCRIQGGATGRVWGAWPVRGRDVRGVLAAAGFDSGIGLGVWERIALEWTAAWSGATSVATDPVPAAGGPWHTPTEFRTRLELAIARHEHDGQPYSVHRLHARVAPGTLAAFGRDVAKDLRGADVLCRVGSDTLLILNAGPASAFAPVLERMVARWRAIASEQTPPPALACERIELSSRDDRALFLTVAGGWLDGD